MHLYSNFSAAREIVRGTCKLTTLPMPSTPPILPHTYPDTHSPPQIQLSTSYPWQRRGAVPLKKSISEFLPSDRRCRWCQANFTYRGSIIYQVPNKGGGKPTSNSSVPTCIILHHQRKTVPYPLDPPPIVSWIGVLWQSHLWPWKGGFHMSPLNFWS